MKDAIPILLVEDDEDDLFLEERTLNKAGLNSLFHVSDGQSAIDYLSGQKAYADRTKYPLPKAVLLDLKLPEIMGHQVLEWMRTQPELNGCPVYILSSSGETRDRERAEAAKASGYFVKPLTGENVAEIMAQVQKHRS